MIYWIHNSDSVKMLKIMHYNKSMLSLFHYWQNDHNWRCFKRDIFKTKIISCSNLKCIIQQHWFERNIHVFNVTEIFFWALSSYISLK